MTKDSILDAINTVPAYPLSKLFYDQPVKSAVLIVLHGSETDWQVLFTKRASHLSAHPGQISFPGGRFETSDESLEHTAIRETEEEVGLDSTLLTIDAELAPVVTLTGYKIHPYVCFLDHLPALALDHNEVESAFNIPLNFLLHEANIEKIGKQIGEQYVSTYRFDWDEHIIWGATANIIVDLLHRIRESGHMPHLTKKRVESK